MGSKRMTRRCFLAQLLTVAGFLAGPALALSQTRGMMRREDRRQDAGERMEQRGENVAQRQDDPLGMRGVERREDRREIRGDRRSDRRERVY